MRGFITVIVAVVVVVMMLRNRPNGHGRFGTRLAAGVRKRRTCNGLITSSVFISHHYELMMLAKEQEAKEAKEDKEKRDFRS